MVIFKLNTASDIYNDYEIKNYRNVRIYFDYHNHSNYQNHKIRLRQCHDNYFN